MELTDLQTDAMTELINIGYGRAAAALSELTRHRISLEVPKVSMHAIADVSALLSQLVQGEVASVNQVFSGPISGSALLLLDEQAAVMLSRLLTEEHNTSGSLDSSDREIITEVGNIMLNACLGVFGNVLQVQVSFAVPRLQVEGVNGVLRSIVVASQQLTHAVMVHTRFRVRDSHVTGYLVIILGMTSIDRMLEQLEKWGNGEMP